MAETPTPTPDTPVTPGGGAEGGMVTHRGLSVRDQIERYRTAFIAVVTMVIIAAAVGGYILAHENLKLPGWVPVLGRDYFTLKAEFQTAQAVTPGQGQAVTIAGAKIGEVGSVDLNQGLAVVTMRLVPKYARIYHDATLLLRPKTGLQDITVEVNPGNPSSGRVKSGETIPVHQTAPNVDFDQFLAGLDADTRAYLQELLAGAGIGLRGNSHQLSATLKRFDPTARLTTEITKELQLRHENIEHSIHNFRLLMEALGSKDTQIAQLVDASNAVFKTFAQEDANVQSTLQLLPGALKATNTGLGKIAVSSALVGTTLHELDPFAKALAPAQEATKSLSLKTTPVFKNEIRPFAREIEPTINEIAPSTAEIAKAFPHLATSFAVLNEFFNELAYNPGASKGGFLFFLDWGNHNLNSVVSTADAHGPLGRSVIYFNCKVLPLLKGAGEVNPNVNLLVGLLRPPTAEECTNLIGTATSAHKTVGKPAAGSALTGLSSNVFGGAGAPAGVAAAKGSGG